MTGRGQSSRIGRFDYRANRFLIKTLKASLALEILKMASNRARAAKRLCLFNSD
jgi:hypothetical protein